MPTGNISLVASIAGVSVQITVAKTEEGQVGHAVDLPAGKAISSWSKTDNDTGVATVAAGHGFLVGHKVDVYWGTENVRYGLTVTAVTSTTVTVDSGAGDNFPATGTASMVLSKVKKLDVNVDGDLAKIVAASCPKRSHVHWRSSEASGVGGSLDAQHLPAGEGYVWWDGSGVTNPLAGDAIDAVEMSTADTATSPTFTLGILYNSLIF